MDIRTFVLSLFGMLTLAALAPAQSSLTVSEGLQAGGTARVTYSDPGMAGDIVLIEVDNGMGEMQLIEVQLDENGEGCTDWDVPLEGWFAANFNAPGTMEVSRAIAPAPPPVL